MSTTYPSIYDYYNCSDQTDRLTKINTIIDALLDAAAEYAGKSGIQEYWYDDGQTKIKTVYNNLEQIYKDISAYRKLRNTIINDNCIGRTVRLRDEGSFDINR